MWGQQGAGARGPQWQMQQVAAWKAQQAAQWQAQQGQQWPQQAGGGQGAWGQDYSQDPAQAQSAGWGAAVVPPKGAAKGKGAQAAAPAPEPVKEDPPEIVFYVVCTADEVDSGMNTLIGKYKEEGVNHGRKYYRKVEGGAMSEDTEVYIYYWDERDGTDSNGWWFGNMVGGSQVWSRAQQGTPTPPNTGWTIPWDGEVNPDLQVFDRAAKKAHDLKEMEVRKKKEHENRMKAQLTQWQERVQKAKTDSEKTEAAVQDVLEAAKKAGEEGTLEDLVSAVEQLSQQWAILQSLQKAVMEMAMQTKQAPTELKMSIATIMKTVKNLQNSVNGERQKLTAMRSQKVKEAQEAAIKAKEDEKWRALEGEHSAALEAMMAECTKVTDEAEDEVEKVAIAAAPLEIEASDDLESIMNDAITETEERCAGGEKAVAEARKLISGKMSEAMKFGPVVKKTAVEEFGGLQEKIKGMQAKLDKYKNIRKEHELKSKNKALLEELQTKLATSEIEVEQAASISMESVEEVKECEAAVNTAQPNLMKLRSTLTAHSREKDRGATFLEEVASLLEKAQGVHEKLVEVSASVKEARIRIAAADLLQSVSEKVQGVEEIIGQMNQLATTALPNPEDVQADEDKEDGDETTNAAFKQCDEMVVKVQSTFLESQTFLARKLADASKLSDSSKGEAKKNIMEQQKRLGDLRKELEEFKGKVASSRCQKVLRDVQLSANEAADTVEKLKQSMENLGEVGCPGEPASDELKEGVKNMRELEKSALAGVTAVRKGVAQKSLEVKKLAGGNPALGGELKKLQDKGTALQKEIQEVAAKVKVMEERIRIKETLAEVTKWSKSVEEEVDKAQMAAVPLDDDEPDEETAKQQEAAIESAKAKLAHTTKLIDLKLKNARDPVTKEELQACKDRVAKAEETMKAINEAAKEQEQRSKAQDFSKSAGEKVDKVEAEIAKVGEADEVFLKGEDLAASELAAALNACDAAIAGADKAVADAENFIAESLADAAEFCAEARDLCEGDLQAASSRLEGVVERLKELKAETHERKKGAQAALSEEKVKEVERAIEKLDATVKSFDGADKAEDAPEVDEAKAAEEITEMEKVAQATMADARKFVTDGLSEARNYSGDERRQRTSLLSKMQSKLTQSQVQLGKLSRIVGQRGAALKSKKLVQEANASLESMQAELETCNKVAAPVVDAEKSELVVTMLLSTLVQALRQHMAASGLSVEALFEKVAGQGATSVTADSFSGFLLGLPEMTGQADLLFSKEHSTAMLGRIGTEDSFSIAEFQALFAPRYICKERVPLLKGPPDAAAEDASEAGMLEVDEVVKVLKQEVKEGNTYAQCALGRDDTSFWVLLARSEGKAPLAVCESGAWQVESIEAYINSIFARCSKILESLDAQIKEVRDAKEGPLASLKTTLMQLKMKAGTEHGKVEQMKKRVAASKAAAAKEAKEAAKAVSDGRAKAIAQKAVKDVEVIVDSAEAKVTKVVEQVKSRNAESLQKDLGAGELEDIKLSADDALKGLTDAKNAGNKALKSQDSVNGARSALLEIRVSITKLLSRVSSAERRLKIVIDPVQKAYDAVVGAVLDNARASFRTAVRRLGKDLEALFDEIAGGQGEMSDEQWTALFEQLPEHGLSKDDVALLYRSFGPEKLTKQTFVSSVQEYFICEKGTTMTSSFDLGESSTVLRKLDVGEIVEVVEGPQEHADTQVMRAKARAIKDGKEGWVSIKGNKGTPYMKPVGKPFMEVKTEAPLYTSFDDKSAVVRTLEPEEVLELLEGPQERTISSSELTLRGTASKDNITGWITLRDSQGVEFASSRAGMFKCKGNIAMTDNSDVRNCKVVRKIEVGEILELLPEEGEEASAAGDEVARRRFKAIKDGKEGWVTLKGSSGTLFLEEVKTNYVISRAIALRSSAARNAPPVRELEEGEVFLAAGPPREERPERLTGVRLRSQKDGSAGWAVYPGKTSPVVMRK